jgi:eukaryotic-like serine/threonine-protein kinase
MIGRTIGKYRIVDKLGKGGMGTVFRAVDETLDRDVAVKVLNPELTDSDVMKRFRAEATTLAKLNHPEIATIHEIYRSDSDLLMVMELIRGETLDQLSVRSGPLPPDRAAYLVAQVLGALEHAHRAGIVHRDLKPANVMVTEHGGIKIMDFGIARVSGAEHLTNDGHMMGTPAYMAPEQVLAKEVDHRADIYSCGVVFYRLLTGKLPFEADTAIGMVQKQLSDAPKPAHEHRADLPDWCQTVLDRALAKSPADRYQTCMEFRDALLAAIGANATEYTSVLAAAHIGSTPPLGAAVGSTPSAPAHTPAAGARTVAARRPKASATRAAKPAASPDGATIVLQKNHFAVAGGLLAAVAVGVGVLAFVAIRGRGPAAAPAPAAAVTPAATPSAASQTPAAASQTPAATETAAVSAPPTTAGPIAAAPAIAPAVTAPAAAPARTPATVAASAKTPAERATPVRADLTASKTAATVPPASAAKPARSAAAVSVPTAASAAAKEAATAFVFNAKAVVTDGGKNREHDVYVQMANGAVTVEERNHVLVTSVPYRSLVAVNASSSKQPLWQSPSGPAEAAKVDGGALRFLKGSRNWLVLRTAAATVILRVDDDDVGRVTSALEERTGMKVVRIVERKD